MYKKWRYVYSEDYLKHCQDMELKPLSYSGLLKVRKQYRPQYVVSRKISARKKIEYQFRYSFVVHI